MLRMTCLLSAFILTILTLSGCGESASPLTVAQRYVQALQHGSSNQAGDATCTATGGTSGWLDNSDTRFADLTYSQLKISDETVLIQVAGNLHTDSQSQPFQWEIRLHDRGDRWCVVEITDRQKVAAAN